MTKILAFSDLHCDLQQARELVERSKEVDVVVGVGDFASVHSGLDDTIQALCAISCPTVLVAGNNETVEALRKECAEWWPNAQVLHGQGSNIAGVPFWGVGGGIPPTPWDWSFDLTEAEAEALLEDCPNNAVLVVHSPPQGHVDGLQGQHFGSNAVLQTIRRSSPEFVLCGHIHECWGQQSSENSTKILNLGPKGIELELG